MIIHPFSAMRCRYRTPPYIFVMFRICAAACPRCVEVKPGHAQLIGSAFSQCTIPTTASIDGNKMLRKEIEMHEMTNIIRFTLTMPNPCAFRKIKKRRRGRRRLYNRRCGLCGCRVCQCICTHHQQLHIDNTMKRNQVVSHLIISALRARLTNLSLWSNDTNNIDEQKKKRTNERRKNKVRIEISREMSFFRTLSCAQFDILSATRLFFRI